ncbi:MAG: helix-turn-helix domain-containing protein [Deltaproteobacteria bacterium]|jgi:transposase|nr:helix-turn-helix domain-containing protein [Deltaproteobacteria bacterium]
MATKYVICLTEKERYELDSMVKMGKTSGRVILLALALLFCDISPEGRGAKTNAQISKELNLSERTIEKLKKRFMEGGIEVALKRKKRPTSPLTLKFDESFQAKLFGLASSAPPAGRARWTVRLLAEKLVELGIATKGISHMTVQRFLKKGSLK